MYFIYEFLATHGLNFVVLLLALVFCLIVISLVTNRNKSKEIDPIFDIKDIVHEPNHNPRKKL